MNKPIETLAPWLFTIGLFIVWELSCRLFNVSSIILPAPSEIFVAMARFLVARDLSRALSGHDRL